MATLLIKNKFQALITKKTEPISESKKVVAGRKVGLMAKLFGCRHGNMGRPFSNGTTAYRACLKCGARRQFNIQTLETHGSFYFPTLAKDD